MTEQAAPWTDDEFAGLNLGDKRLNERVISMVQQCAGNRTASFTQTFNGSAEVMAAYRLFDNDEVKVEKFLAPHWANAEQRARSHPVVLALQDTTELNFHGQQIDGLGSLSYPAQRGMYLLLAAAQKRVNMAAKIPHQHPGALPQTPHCRGQQLRGKRKTTLRLLPCITLRKVKFAPPEKRAFRQPFTPARNPIDHHQNGGWRANPPKLRD
jgi:hypothetical protein